MCLFYRELLDLKFTNLTSHLGASELAKLVSPHYVTSPLGVLLDESPMSYFDEEDTHNLADIFLYMNSLDKLSV